jgi:ankyrin repeat protein
MKDEIEIVDAILDGDIEKLNALISDSCQIFQGITDADCWNLLHLALVDPTVRTPPAMIQYLIGKGVSVNAVDLHGYTPLHFAARQKYTDAIKLLLDAGAAIDPINEDGITPLRQTLLSKPYSIEATELLLSRGADPEKGKTGQTVRDYVKVIAHGLDRVLLDLFDRYK